MVNICLTLQEAARMFSKVYLVLQKHERFILSSHQHLVFQCSLEILVNI